MSEVHRPFRLSDGRGGSNGSHQIGVLARDSHGETVLVESDEPGEPARERTRKVCNVKTAVTPDRMFYVRAFARSQDYEEAGSSQTPVGIFRLAYTNPIWVK